MGGKGGGVSSLYLLLKSIRLVVGTMSDSWGALAHWLEGSLEDMYGTYNLGHGNVQLGSRLQAVPISTKGARKRAIGVHFQ